LGGGLVLGEVQFVFDLLLALHQLGQPFGILEGRVDLGLGVGQAFARVGKVARQGLGDFFEMLDDVCSTERMVPWAVSVTLAG
jgi:hypothetical protein